MSDPFLVSFGEQSARLDTRLDDALAVLRQRRDSGEISERQAADFRIATLERHLDALTALRIEHFGAGDPATGWLSGTMSTEG